MGQLNDMDWEHVDVAAVAAAIIRNGVISGLAVSESAAPAMSVLVASGSCIESETTYTESSGQNLNISNGDATHPRKDIIVYDTTAGNPAVVEGTPSAAPITPDIPAGDIYLAMVHVDANETTSILDADIDDGRCYVVAVAVHMLEHLEGGNDTISYYDRFEAADLYTNAPERTVNSTTYQKKKEIEMTVCADTITIRFSLASGLNTGVYGQIYRNGVAVGTERLENHATSGAYYTFDETISGWSDGDLLQLYLKGYTTTSNWCKNLIIRGEIKTLERDTSGFTSQL